MITSWNLVWLKIMKINNFPIIDNVMSNYKKIFFSSKHYVSYINRFVFWYWLNFYYKTFWNLSVEEILMLNVLTMKSSVNTWKLIFCKKLIIVYHLKDIWYWLFFVIANFYENLLKKRYRGFKRVKMTCVIKIYNWNYFISREKSL